MVTDTTFGISLDYASNLPRRVLSVLPPFSPAGFAGRWGQKEKGTQKEKQGIMGAIR